MEILLMLTPSPLPTDTLSLSHPPLELESCPIYILVAWLKVIVEGLLRIGLNK